ncbi:MAG: hypothetical protein ACLR2E_04335 [Lachnospiraceae bacterium]
MPTVIGTDLKGMAAEIGEHQRHFHSFGFPTTGLDYYDKRALPMSS